MHLYIPIDQAKNRLVVCTLDSRSLLQSSMTLWGCHEHTCRLRALYNLRCMCRFYRCPLSSAPTYPEAATLANRKRCQHLKLATIVSTDYCSLSSEILDRGCLSLALRDQAWVLLYRGSAWNKLSRIVGIWGCFLLLLRQKLRRFSLINCWWCRRFL